MRPYDTATFDYPNLPTLNEIEGAFNDLFRGVQDEPDWIRRMRLLLGEAPPSVEVGAFRDLLDRQESSYAEYVEAFQRKMRLVLGSLLRETKYRTSKEG